MAARIVGIIVRLGTVGRLGLARLGLVRVGQVEKLIGNILLWLGWSLAMAGPGQQVRFAYDQFDPRSVRNSSHGSDLTFWIDIILGRPNPKLVWASPFSYLACSNFKFIR